MKEKIKVPKLRFKEFSGEWEEKRLGEIFEIFNGYAFKSQDSQAEGIRWIKIADVGIQKMVEDNLSYLPKEYIELYEKFKLLEGDYVVALTRPILNKKLKIARINNSFHNSLLNQRVGKLISNEKLDYIYFLLQQDEIISKIDSTISGSDPPNLSPTEINGIKTIIPSLPEQQKIANFLSKVDEKIEKLTKKKELLEQYKKGVMQKIFSQEIRFKDDNGNDFPEWEEKEFEKLYEFKTTNSLSRDNLNYENGIVKNIHYGDIHTKFKAKFDITKELVPFINNDIDLSKIKEELYIKEGDLLIADASENYDDIGKAIEIVNINNEKLVGGLHTFLARPYTKELYLGFPSFLMRTSTVFNQIRLIAQGAKVLGISTTRLSKIILPLPSLPEQQKIADFLSVLDKKIDIIDKELGQVQEFKKGLLQQMFV